MIGVAGLIGVDGLSSWGFRRLVALRLILEAARRRVAYRGPVMAYHEVRDVIREGRLLAPDPRDFRVADLWLPRLAELGAIRPCPVLTGLVAERLGRCSKEYRVYAWTLASEFYWELEIQRHLAQQRQGTRTDINPTSAKDFTEVQRATDLAATTINAPWSGRTCEKLHAVWLQCHTNQEIADKIGLGDKARVSEICLEFKKSEKANKFCKGHYRDFSDFREKSLNLRSEPPQSFQLTNLWDFPRADPSYGTKWPGRMLGGAPVE